jgi:ssDNA-binding Zn-finger/Zn-ribbon topoisomerase 1
VNRVERERGVCPVCNGSGRVPAGDNQYKEIYSGYDKATDTLKCDNCGGQYMYGQPTGKVLLRRDNNQPCVHEYEGTNAGRCLTSYNCKHCGDYFQIDSGD